MEEHELADRILNICHDHAKPVYIKQYLKERDKIDLGTQPFKMNFAGAIKLLKHYQLIEEHESHLGGDIYITTTPKGHKIMSEYKSFSSWLKSESNENKKRARTSNIDVILKAIGGAGVISAIIFSIMNFRKDKTIQQNEFHIRNLQGKIDSLNRKLSNEDTVRFQPHENAAPHTSATLPGPTIK